MEGGLTRKEKAKPQKVCFTGIIHIGVISLV